jgi:hypothetical protein
MAYMREEVPTFTALAARVISDRNQFATPDALRLRIIGRPRHFTPLETSQGVELTARLVDMVKLAWAGLKGIAPDAP